MTTPMTETRLEELKLHRLLPIKAHVDELIAEVERQRLELKAWLVSQDRPRPGKD